MARMTKRQKAAYAAMSEHERALMHAEEDLHEAARILVRYGATVPDLAVILSGDDAPCQKVADNLLGRSYRKRRLARVECGPLADSFCQTYRDAAKKLKCLKTK